MMPENDNQQPFDISFHLSGEHFETLKAVTQGSMLQFVTCLSAVVMAAQLGVTVDIVTTSEPLASTLKDKFTAELFPNVTVTFGPVSGPPLET